MSDIAIHALARDSRQAPTTAAGAVMTIIVSYRTPEDVRACLASLDTLPDQPEIRIHVCENGGPAAWETLCATIAGPGGCCDRAETPDEPAGHRFTRVGCFRLRKTRRLVLVGEAPENLGYAGAINAWIGPLRAVRGWFGCWVINPDATALPNTLTTLIEDAAARDLGMAGSRVMGSASSNRIRSRGLRWARFRANTAGIDIGAVADHTPDAAAIDAQMDAATGASVFISRACVEPLFPMDERYFLYYEDLDWGVRVREAGFRIGHTHDSVVIHAGGGSLGSTSRSHPGSPLSLYLIFRNRLLFVRKYFPFWLPWTVVMSFVHCARVARGGGAGPAFRGIMAGLRGETGRPEWLVAHHQMPERPSEPRRAGQPG